MTVIRTLWVIGPIVVGKRLAHVSRSLRIWRIHTVLRVGRIVWPTPLDEAGLVLLEFRANSVVGRSLEWEVISRRGYRHGLSRSAGEIEFAVFDVVRRRPYRRVLEQVAHDVRGWRKVTKVRRKETGEV